MKQRYARRPKKASPPPPSSTQEWALAYAAQGWRVLPIWGVDEAGRCRCGSDDCTTKNRGKHPVTSLAPHGALSATSNTATIKKWFATFEQHNIGIATGPESNLTVVDVDVGEGKCGTESWRLLNEGHAEPVTLMATTGSGGMHVLFPYHADIPGKNNVLGPNIDVKNKGGYIVVCPSRHRSGGSYAWLNWPTPLAAWPQHFLPVAKQETRGRPRKDDHTRRKTYTIKEIEEALKVIPAGDRDVWREVGIILGRTFEMSDEAWAVYTAWAATWGGKQERGHDKIMHEAFYLISQQPSERELSIGTIVKLAIEHGWVPVQGATPIEEFIYYNPDNKYVYRLNGKLWPAAGVDAAVSPVNVDGKIIKATEWLKVNRQATTMANDPLVAGDYVKGVNYDDGEIIPMAGAAIYNSYRAPTIVLGDPRRATRWVEHTRRMMPREGDADQCFNYLAHRVQHPGVKPRFALLIGGEQGIGKDTTIAMSVPAMGARNMRNIEPSAFNSSFNEYATGTLVVISESTNHEELSKWAFNEQLKTLIAGTPDLWDINPKYGLKFRHRLHNGTILTTNHLDSGIYIPQDDRRFDVIECATLAEMGLADRDVRRFYFELLWTWFLKGGNRHVAAWLHERDISQWSPDHGQRKTEAHADVVQANRESDMWCVEILEELMVLDWPKDLCIVDAEGHCVALKFVRADWIIDRAVTRGENKMDARRKLKPTMKRCGYVAYNNKADQEGRWWIGGKAYKVYARQGTPRGLHVPDFLTPEMKVFT